MYAAMEYYIGTKKNKLRKTKKATYSRRLLNSPPPMGTLNVQLAMHKAIPSKRNPEIYRSFPHTLSSHKHAQTSPLSKSCTRFVKTSEPVFIHYNHSKSIVYVMGHSWWCTVCGFCHMYI